MAWLDKDPSGFFHVCFRLGERKLKRSLRTKNDRQANAACLRLEENLRLVELGCLELPSGGDIPVFFANGWPAEWQTRGTAAGEAKLFSAGYSLPTCKA